MPDDGCLVRLRPENAEEIVACVIGQLGQEHGIVLFDSVAACARWRTCVSAAVPDAWAPSAVSLTYAPLASLPPAIRARVRTLQLPLAGPVAFPIALRTGRALEPEPITSSDLARLTFAARALALVVKDDACAWPPALPSDIVIVDGTSVAIDFAQVP